jgi:hypothetical protein
MSGAGQSAGEKWISCTYRTKLNSQESYAMFYKIHIYVVVHSCDW